MRLLLEIRPKEPVRSDTKILRRQAARAIVLRSDEILLLYTARYNDYSFPGGGVQEDEDLIAGLKRELVEETGARHVLMVREFGYVDELRPHYRPDYDLIHMLSYLYICEIDGELGSHQMEHYEIANGMEARWVNIFEAIRHNRAVIAAQEKSMGLSIERETRVLEIVAQELVKTHPSLG